ncbi:protein O-mannosyl-transferase TMTC1-like [Tigriopus californicus]|uniref:protein O-mannosyl-transferase TMTC1-like n=1 Tax=Tigriopus californicus TaxID=6832 RepID=UPI0027D9D426|nr:protein O-mannosyl-transferase TMTC1-like [Tigriopus californicus]
MLDRKKADEEAEEEKEERNSGFGTRNDTREHERTEIMESKRNSKCSWNCLKECPHFFVVFGFVTLVYWNSLTGDFVHDDNPAILQNPMVTDANTSIWNILTHDFWGTQLDSSASHKSFRPITTLVFRLLFQWGGGSPVPFHVFNLCLHTFVTWAIATLPSKLMPSTTDTTTATKSLSFNCLAALFIVQSIHTETVSGLVGAADLLATSLSIISVYLFHKLIYSVQISDSPGILFCASQGFQILSLLSKESGAMTPFIKSALLISQETVSWRKLLKRGNLGAIFLAEIALSVVYMFARIFLVTRFCPWPIFSPMDNPAAFHSSIFTRAMTFLYLSIYSLWLMICPISLSYDWQMGSIELIESVWDTRCLLVLTFYPILGGFLYQLWRPLRPASSSSSSSSSCSAISQTACTTSTSGSISSISSISGVSGINRCPSSPSGPRSIQGPEDRTLDRFATLILIFSYIPASNLVFYVGFVLAERVLYMPSIGLSLLISHGFTRLIQSRSQITALVGKILFAILIVSQGLRTCQRNQDWQSRDALLRAGVKTLPHNAKAHYNLANACKDNGRLEVAVAHYKEAIKLWPTYTEAHNNLAAILPDPKEATKHLEMALTIDPGHPTSLYNLALMLSQDGQCAQAIPLLERSLVERYNFEPAQRLLLECLRLSPKFESNPHQFLLPMDIHSEVDLTLNELVDVYIRMRHWDKAFQLLHFCLEKRPSSSVAYYQLSQVYFEQRKINLALEAVEMAKRTCLQTNFCSQIQLQEADIWQESLDFERAAEGYKEALQQFPDDSRILLNLGSSYHMMGERHKARQYYEKALALNPSNSLAQTNLALLQWEQTNKTLGSSWFWDHQSLSTSFQNDI